MPAPPPPELDPRLRRWQGVTLGTLFVGYAGYYLCRSNLSVATPLILDEYHDAGVTEANVGDVASLGLLAYAVGKLTLGWVADAVGGRRVFLVGLFGAVVCTLLFGAVPWAAGAFAPAAAWLGLPAAVLLPFALAWVANRSFQSIGWGGLVQLSTRWFPPARIGTVLGALSVSYLIGDAVARETLGRVIDAGGHWRTVFFCSAAMLGLIGLVVWALLKPGPAAVGCGEPNRTPGEELPNGADHVTWRQRIAPLVRNRAFWLVCGMSLGLTFLRETLTFWSPTFLNKVVNLAAGDAARASQVMPWCGAVAV